MKVIASLSCWATDRTLYRSAATEPRYGDFPVWSYRSVPGRDVLQSPEGGLPRAVTHAASQQGEVHPDSDGTPQPLGAPRVGLFFQQGAVFFHIL